MGEEKYICPWVGDVEENITWSWRTVEEYPNWLREDGRISYMTAGGGRILYFAVGRICRRKHLLVMEESRRISLLIEGLADYLIWQWGRDVEEYLSWSWRWMEEYPNWFKEVEEYLIRLWRGDLEEYLTWSWRRVGEYPNWLNRGGRISYLAVGKRCRRKHHLVVVRLEEYPIDWRWGEIILYLAVGRRCRRKHYLVVEEGERISQLIEGRARKNIIFCCGEEM